MNTIPRAIDCQCDECKLRRKIEDAQIRFYNRKEAVFVAAMSLRLHGGDDLYIKLFNACEECQRASEALDKIKVKGNAP